MLSCGGEATQAVMKGPGVVMPWSRRLSALIGDERGRLDGWAVRRAKEEGLEELIDDKNSEESENNGKD
ncbi:hypothetical protein J056_003248 [Wallemia ichthyophaga EXF-994]|uniref:Uncharacterized protein n=1 Tax=Wallemia ichthyophaga (strain EXF-994 / CBS 113033) TaxID=1299270 RepID=R9A9B2_WALI9|nr:uncharacterized protein J056_003248 [Wallemia ichthyophaga EXF-994]EOQ98659.1 hypothetical protein J056_003248 [Wallemia ichthyophaga EXF-994]